MGERARARVLEQHNSRGYAGWYAAEVRRLTGLTDIGVRRGVTEQ